MPRFPGTERYESKRALTTQQPSFFAPESTKGKVLESVSDAGLKLTDTASKLATAFQSAKDTASELNSKVSIADISQRAAVDPDINSLKKYYGELDKTIRNNSQGVSDGAQKKLAVNVQLAKIELEGVFRKKQVDFDRANTQALIDLQVKNPSPESEKYVEGLLNEKTALGIYSREEAYERLEKAKKSIKFNDFAGDLQANPKLAGDLLAKNEYQFDSGDLIKAKNIYKSELTRTQAVNQNDLFSAYLDGHDLDIESINDLVKQEKISAKFGYSLINKIKNPKPDEVSKDLAYIEFQNRGADLLSDGGKATIEELSQFMVDTMSAHSKGLLDKSDVQKFIGDADEILSAQLDKSASKITEKASPKNLLEHLSFWVDEHADKKSEIKARMYRKLIDGISEGKDATELLVNIIDQETNLLLNEQIQKPDRQFAVNPESGQRIYSDDGGATWFDEKSGKEFK